MIWHPYTIQKGQPDPLKIVRAKGEFLYDINGNSYIDAVSSWWISIHGHNHPYIIERVKESLSNIDHVLLAGYTHESAEELARELIDLNQNTFKAVFYSDNGSCAIDIAIKIATQYFKNLGKTKKETFLHFSQSYHGDTIGAMSVAGKSTFNSAFGNLLFFSPEFTSPDCYNCPLKKNPTTCKEECLSNLEEYLKANSETTAAMIIEPIIQGAEGMKIYKKEILVKLKQLAETYDVLLILDEIFTGFGRTGKNFAYEQAAIKPDIITLAKGLSGGVMPLAATLVTEKIYEAFFDEDPKKAFYHGHTMTGNPTACAAGLASITLYKKEKRLEDVVRLEKYFTERITDLKTKFSDKVLNPRILGSICAFELEGESNYLHPISKKIKAFSIERGVLIRPLGNTIYVAPPYTIKEESLEKIFDVVQKIVETH
ncbi:MAG TPA: adenosylmethionine--8-amino-7-oxononanoate transaminase [Leptospiraceae bacterium]|nr:adenosylmethionine--8-amino-7-oxononanoate transaminase [Leptospiraceae bacterium]HMW05768.1 adenosylmethionine--8-amino-7-oxononanoate transaminase [Leptospiraceae bacterium]HMX33848.1 adenosylmethionine--8-amino-7-oxononanoate transaminase [Leptospiraceae bacterium]HMY33357.1 adenosylmethionine--8-amino-7-oxononanoate transaminase [Leptospiraceae bacterium]HMZ65430.1 adenosylmethionine--8-amino-7-oxononanoate transaminase [Leptospiraceae bacterium]